MILWFKWIYSNSSRNDHSDYNLSLRISSKRKRLRSSTKRKQLLKKFSILVHAQDKLLCLVIVAEMTSNFRQEIRYSYYRNDPVKYDLNFTTSLNITYDLSIHQKHLSFQQKKLSWKMNSWKRWVIWLNVES